MSEKRAKYLLVALIALYTGLFGLFTIERHQRLETSTFDLGIFDQAVYLLSQGESLFLTTRGLHVHADHFHPILYLAAPLYLIWSSPYALLLFQTLILGLGAYPAYSLARHYQIAPKWALVVAAAYLTHPTVSFLNAFDFHPVSFMATALMFALMYLERGSPLGYALSLVLALACTEAAGFTVIALAVTALWARNLRWAAGTFLLGVAGLVTAKVSLRFFNNGASTPYSALYTDYGSSEAEVVLHLLTKPLASAASLTTPLNLEYLFYLVGPLLLLPLLSPERLLPAVPTLLGNLLSWRYSQHRVEYHYGAAIAPFLIWAAVVGWSRLRKRGASETWLGGLLAVAVAACVYFGPAGLNHTEDFLEDADLRGIDQLVRPDDVVSAECTLGSHLTQRDDFFLFPSPFVPSAWGNAPDSLVQQSSAEYKPFGRGAVRRGLEFTKVNCVVLPTDPERGSEFPLRLTDYVFAVRQVLRSKQFHGDSVGDVKVLRRKVRP